MGGRMEALGIDPTKQLQQAIKKREIAEDIRDVMLEKLHDAEIRISELEEEIDALKALLKTSGTPVPEPKLESADEKKAKQVMYKTAYRMKAKLEKGDMITARQYCWIKNGGLTDVMKKNMVTNYRVYCEINDKVIKDLTFDKMLQDMARELKI